MSVDAQLHALGRAARRRRGAIVVLIAAPIVAAIAFFGARAAGFLGAPMGVAVGVGAVVVLARRAMRAIDDAWIARRLDASRTDFEDSADLLFRDAAALSPLQQLQRARLDERFGREPVADVAPAWPARSLALAWGLSLAAIVLVLLARPPVHDEGAPRTTATADARSTHIESVRLDVTAPAYTKLAPRSETTLETRVAEGSRIAWHLRFAPEPKAAALVFHDGSRIELALGGGEWSGERAFPVSALYRIVLDGAPPVEDDRLHRLDVIADQAPDVRVLEPEKSLTLLADGQRTWNLVFEASDDYGIASANLTITLAQGTGENIAFKEQIVALEPLTPPSAAQAVPLSPASRARDVGGPPVVYRYAYGLDLAALGLSEGDDVIVRLAVADHRDPTPNTTRSASFILRWPPEASSDSVGMEGIVEKTMPAYFRSQRQIILDTEALIAEAPPLDEDKRLARSDSIGVDQKILRLRYGQFLGEEFETRSAPASPAESEHKDTSHESQADALTDHDHQHAGNTPSKFGDMGDVMAEYGHTHDHAEAATLLDPETKAIIKSALNEMWQAELHLRQGRPADALPFEYKALGYIKEVQQATRIYLARVGLELPQVDEGRRLSGDRKGVTDRESALAPADAGDTAPSVLWHALDANQTPDLDAFERWVRARESTLPDALGLLAASDRVRRDPTCEECRRQLRGLLWPLLPQPATATALRPAVDESGRAYLDAIGAKESRP